MKINFNEKDSLYKIFNTIEKIHWNKKNIKISIDPNNPFFENIWWWKQLKDTLETKGLDYEFLSKDLKTGKYYQELGVKHIHEKWPLINRIANSIYQFFFKAKNAHISMLKEKNYFAYLIIFLEIIAVCYIFYMFYALISPSAKIYIKASYSMEEIVYNFRYYPYSTWWTYDSKYISIPYHQWTLDISNSINFNVANIKYLQKPATWKIKITNTSWRWYSLKTNTKFITDDWLLFKAKSWINIDEWTVQNPSYTYVDVESMDIDNKWQIIWDRWNITKWTTLYIRNLQDSFFLKKIYATTETDLKWGQTLADWTVDQQDIDLMNQKLQEYVENNKKTLLTKSVNDKNKIIINFNDTIKTETTNIVMNWKIWDKLSKLEWTINAKIHYKYVLWDEFKKWVEQYIKERDSKIMKLTEIDQNSVLFYEKFNFNKVFIIPTKVDIIWWYDFNKDVNWIKEEIKSKIIWKTIAEAKKIILDYSQIDVAIVKVAPSWYENIPTLKSRIKIDIWE